MKKRKKKKATKAPAPTDHLYQDIQNLESEKSILLWRVDQLRATNDALSGRVNYFRSVHEDSAFKKIYKFRLRLSHILFWKWRSLWKCWTAKRTCGDCKKFHWSTDRRRLIDYDKHFLQCDGCKKQAEIIYKFQYKP